MTTNEIIKRAQQLADLENSSFISWRENVNLLNEAYKDAYQKAINANIKYWLKDWILKDGENKGQNVTCYKLPKDFYTLYSINEVGTGRNLFRKSINECTDGFKYDIENGELVIYGAMRKDIVVKYYKVPDELYYKGEEVTTNLIKNTMWSTWLNCWKDACDNKIYFFKEDTQKVYIYDIKSDTYTDFTASLTFDTIVGVIATKEGLLVLYENSGDFKLSMCNVDYTTTHNYDDTIWFITEDKHFLLYTETTNEGLFVVVDKTETTIVKKSKKLDINKNDILINYLDLSHDYAILNDGDYANTVIRFDLKTGDKEYFDGQMFDVAISPLYLFDKWVVGNDCVIRGLFLGDDMASGKAGMINKKDYNTSYGWTDLQGVVHSIFDDMKIDTPNSFFDSMLAYSLAIQYKAKQNAMNEGILTLYQNAENQFFNSLPQDTFSNVRIQNVY